MEVRLQRYGDSGFLVAASEFENLNLRVSLDIAFETQPLVCYREHVWGVRNLLILFDRAVPDMIVRSWFRLAAESLVEGDDCGKIHEVPVIYDGPDLEAVGASLGIPVEQIIALHSQAEYRVRMMGFSPGFPYLDGLDPRLQLPRRASPRKRIEPGSVAIGGSHAGIYSVASPGGWHLLGRTELRLFRPEKAVGNQVNADEVFALNPGERVRFVRVEVGGGE